MPCCIHNEWNRTGERHFSQIFHENGNRVNFSSIKPGIRRKVTRFYGIIQFSYFQVYRPISYPAQGVWTAIKHAGLFVDVIVRNLILLEKHIADLTSAISSGVHNFVVEDIVPFLYNIEEFLVQQMKESIFFERTFGWLAKGIIYFIQHMRGSIVIG